VKHREIGGMYFNLKGGVRAGPTKLSITLSAEGSHRGRTVTDTWVFSRLVAQQRHVSYNQPIEDQPKRPYLLLMKHF